MTSASGKQRKGHRLAPHTADCVVEAWAPELVPCLAEAMAGLVAVFAEPVETATTRTVPVSAGPGPGSDLLVSLLEEVIYVTDVLGVVPVRFHLAETEDGGVAGDMEVVEAGDAVLVGPVPKVLSYNSLELSEHDGTWRCRVVVDV